MRKEKEYSKKADFSVATSDIWLIILSYRKLILKKCVKITNLILGYDNNNTTVCF